MSDTLPGALLATGLTAFAVAVPLVWLVRRTAVNWQLVAAPRPDRVHERPTPHLGGVAITASVLVAGWLSWAVVGPVPGAVVLTAAGLAIAGLGLYDDLAGASPWLRLAVETIAAGLLVAGAGGFPLTGWPTVDAAASIAALVVVTNSFNLLDNSDAALAVVAIVLGVAIAGHAALAGAVTTGVLAAAVAGAGVGFLCFNWPPASIFMGDAGSLFIGFTLLGSLLLVDRAAGWSPVVLAGLLVVPLADTTIVVWTRRREHRSVMRGGKDHLHHRLARTSLGAAGAAVVAGTAAAAGAAVTLLAAGGVLPVAVAVAVVGAIYLGLVAWAVGQPSGSPVAA